MKRRHWLLIVGLALVATAPAGADTLLLADFTGMTVGQPVGTGGAAAGEPVSFDCAATIRDTPFPTTCLELDDENDMGAAGAHFTLLGDAEVGAGLVEISAKLWFAEVDGYYFYVREALWAAQSFNDITFTDSGDVYAHDATGFVGVIGTYETGRAIDLVIVHDLDAGTYDIWWDGELVVEDRAHGIVGNGVGGVYVGVNWDPELDGVFYLDDLLVTTGPFTANETRSWGDLKAGWR